MQPCQSSHANIPIPINWLVLKEPNLLCFPLWKKTIEDKSALAVTSNPDQRRKNLREGPWPLWCLKAQFLFLGTVWYEKQSLSDKVNQWLPRTWKVYSSEGSQFSKHSPAVDWPQLPFIKSLTLSRLNLRLSS